MRYLSLVFAALVITGCGDSESVAPPVQQDPAPVGYQYSQSNMPRDVQPQVSSAAFEQLIDNNNDFALRLYQWQAENDENLFFAPMSVSLAMAMSYAGARQQTATEMATALNFQLPDEQLHSAMNKLLLQLHDTAATGDYPITFNLTQASWLEQSYVVLPEYLDLLAVHYDAGVHQIDFKEQPDKARATINNWVAEQTEGKLSELLAEGSVTADTRLMLLNTMFFKANWAQPFKPADTQQVDFFPLNGSTVQVPMMQRDAVRTLYAEGAGYQVIRLAYANQQFAMLVLVPSEGNFIAFEAELNLDRLQQIRQQLSEHLVDLTLPKFQLQHQLNLKSVLQDFGMQEAFQPGSADFSGIDGTQSLFIGSAVHQAVIDVDEYGTEAAAATAVEMGVTSAPPPAALTVNRPFIYLIEEQGTGAILFMGRFLEP
ncbi:serpin family protein [Alkalimonas sp.]|uniref:serpin family protein n=1 Tax=Alkalimonas sp. TaxID=1872453 RepID=UPI00263B7E53|nr:serpin family protein [Alkalimonas sp.]MCC5825898.1 serpin family protein [Alkalimonas sp.]